MSEWCKHNGDSRTPNTTIVDLRLRDGSEKHGEHADMWHWNHSGQAGDIMEYRIAAALPEPDASERSECALELRMHAMVLRNNPEPLSKECRHELSTALERAAALLSRSLGEPTVPIATPYGESEPDRETGFSVGSPSDRLDAATALLLEVKPLLAQVALQALVGSEMYRASKHIAARIDSHLAPKEKP